MSPLRLFAPVVPAVLIASGFYTGGLSAQTVRGNCNVVIGELRGSANAIHVNCPGVPPAALAALQTRLGQIHGRLGAAEAKSQAQNRRLSRLEHSLYRGSARLQREADEWARKYFEVRATLGRLSRDDAAAARVRAHLDAGELDQAREILDQLIDAREGDVGKSAEYHFLQAKVSDLRFDHKRALRHYATAHRYRPENATYCFAYGEKLNAQNEHRQAFDMFTRASRLFRRKALTDSPSVMYLAVTLFNLGALHEDFGRLDAAEESYLESVSLAERVAHRPGATDAFIAGPLLRLSEIYRESDRREEALRFAERAVKTYRKKTRDENGRLLLALSLMTVAFQYNDPGRHREALARNREALKIARALARDGSARYRGIVAGLARAQAITHDHLEQYRPAETLLDEGLAIYRELAPNDPQAYNASLATMLDTLGSLYRETGRPREAQAAHEEAIDLLRPLHKQNPGSFQLDLARVLNNLALDYDVTGQVKPARKSYAESLKLFTALSRENPKIYRFQMAGINYNLGLSYNRTDDDRRARGYFGRALKIMDALVVSDPGVYDEQHVDILDEYGLACAHTGKFADGRRAFERALEILERLQPRRPNHFAGLRGVVYRHYAFLEFKARKRDRAHELVDRAIELSGPAGRALPGKFGDDRARALDLKATIYSQTKMSVACEWLVKARDASYSTEHKTKISRKHGRYCR